MVPRRVSPHIHKLKVCVAPVGNSLPGDLPGGGGGLNYRIFYLRSLRSWCIKGTDESTLGKDSSVPLMYHDPGDLGSKIRIRIFPKKRTLIFCIALRKHIPFAPYYRMT